MYLAYVFFSGPFLQEGDEQFQLFVFVWWLWAYFPVKILVRDGQQVGVVTNALTNSAPSSRISRCVFVITFADPSSLSMSSRRMKITLGRLIDLLPLCRFAFDLRTPRVEPHCSSRNSKAANVEVFFTWLAFSCRLIAVPKRLTACWSVDVQAQRDTLEETSAKHTRAKPSLASRTLNNWLMSIASTISIIKRWNYFKKRALIK